MFGMYANISCILAINKFSIHGSNMIIVRIPAIILGTQVIVDSWICVTAWNMLINKPTTILTTRIGVDSIKINIKTFCVSVKKTESSIIISFDYFR
jgi:hypothetical protein